MSSRADTDKEHQNSKGSDRLSDKSSKRDKQSSIKDPSHHGEDDRVSVYDEIRELREYVMNMKNQLKTEISLEMKLRRGSEDGSGTKDGSATPADGGFSAPRAPQVGMTPEQTGEFKKQIMHVSTLQTKVKELETKLTETNKIIKTGEDRLMELSELEGHNSHELYSSIDEINNSLSEKIALQRVEVQKLADDLPKPINYDPFNYGEAYGGDLVDFQARKRIIELKCMLTSLRNRIEELQNKVSESPKVNLGYTIMRLDDILHSTGFDKMVKTGATSRSEVMLLTPPDQERLPGRVDFPRKEIFQSAEEQPSKWAITDSIMQTMYRLETEVADLQKMIGTAGVDAQNMALNEMKSALRVLKDTKIDQNSARKMIEEIASCNVGYSSTQQKVHRSGSNNKGPYDPMARPSEDGRFISSDKFITVIRNVNSTIEALMGRVEGCEANTRTMSPRSAATRMTHCPTLMTDRNCLTCDADVQRPPPRQGSPAQRQADFSLPRLPEFGTRPGELSQRDRLPPRIRHFLSSGYDIRVNNEVVGVFRVDDQQRPENILGVRSPRFHTSQPEAPGNRRAYNLGDVPSLLPRNRCNYYMKGKDNKVYQADPHFNHESWVQEMKQKRDKTQNIEKEKRMQLSQLRRYQNEKLFTQIQYKGQAFKSAKKRDSAEIQQSSSTGLKGSSVHGLAGVEAYPTTRRMKPLATRLDYDAALCLKNNLIVVDFMAQWCINCKQAEPRLHDMADTFQQVKFYQVDVDQNEAVAELCRVVSLPTYHVYLNRTKLEELVGASPDRLQQVLMKHLKTMPGHPAAAYMPTVEVEQAIEGTHSRMEWEEKYDSENQAASTIQKGLRQRISNKKEKEVKIHVQKQNKAATKIQSSFRGHLARSAKLRTGQSPSVQHLQFSEGPGMPGSQPADSGFKGSKLRASPISPGGVQLSNTPSPNPQGPSNPAPPPVTPREPEEEVDIDLKDPEVEKAALLIQKKMMFGKKRTPAATPAPSAPVTPAPDAAP